MLSYFEILIIFSLWFIGLGVLLILALLYFIAKYFHKALINLKYGVRGLTNGAKLILIIILILGLWQVYQIHPDINASNGDGEITSFLNLNPIKEKVSNFSENITGESFVDQEEATSSPRITLNFEPTNESLEKCEKLIFEKTNAGRKEQNLRELTWDSSLAIIAREHSRDMAENNFLRHTNLNGEDPTMRAIRHGYNVRKELGGGWYSEGISENIGEMPTGNVIGIGYVSHDPESIATAQVQSWMDSPGHRANILDPQYDRIGVGVAYDGYSYFLTQDFY